MSFFVESSGDKEFKMVPSGTHLARCYRIVDLGTQAAEWNGETKYQRKIMLGWEIHGDDDAGEPLLTDEGKPMAIFKNYTFSWSENSNIRKDLQAWRGQPWSDEEVKRFNLENILGQWCMLNVLQSPGKNGKIYANVAGISPVPGMIKKAGLPQGINELQVFKLNEPDWDLFETFSKGLKAKIESSPEYRAATGKKSAPKVQETEDSFDDLSSDIPF